MELFVIILLIAAIVIVIVAVAPRRKSFKRSAGEDGFSWFSFGDSGGSDSSQHHTSPPDSSHHGVGDVAAPITGDSIAAGTAVVVVMAAGIIE